MFRDDNPNARFLGIEIGDIAAVDRDLAAVDFDETREKIQKRCLAAAGRPEQHDELAVGDVEIEVLDHGDIAVVLQDVAELNGWHVGSIP